MRVGEARAFAAPLWNDRSKRSKKEGMMQLTNAAAQVLKEERARVGVPSDACLRIRRVSGAGGIPAVQLGFVVEPVPTDEVVEHPDLRVFVSSELADVLADCTLDVKETHAGVELVLR